MKITQSNTTFIALMIAALITTACGKGNQNPTAAASSSNSTLAPGQSEPAARLIFDSENFTTLNDFVVPITTSHQCLGDVLKSYYVNGPDYMGSPLPFPPGSLNDALSPTTLPIYIKNVSVDITNTYYNDTQTGVVSTDQCSYRSIASAPLPSSCADFDVEPAAVPAPTVAPTATPNPTPVPVTPPVTPQYYGTGFYQVRDDWCSDQGAIADPDPELTKSYVGGVNIDIDRTQLGANEDLLMMVTYHALNTNSGQHSWPGSLVPAFGVNAAQGVNDTTILEVDLIGTAQNLATLLQVPQPRAWTYYNNPAFPIYFKQIATLEDPYGSLRTDQVYIPLSQNALVDRIRIERIRGSYHLFQIDLYRLGNRGN